MRGVGVGLLGVLLLAVGCSKQTPPPAPRQLMTPHSRLIYHGGISLWTFCDRGSRVYVNEANSFQVIPGGCPDGAP